MNKILKQITPAGHPAVISLYGTEPFFREELLHGILKKCSEWDIRIFDATVTAESEILSTLDEFSLSGLPRLVVVKSPEKLKGKIVGLCNYISDPVSDNMLVLYFENGDTRKEPLKTAVANGLHFKSEPLKTFGDEHATWLKEQALSDGYSLSDDVARIIVVNVGTNLYGLRRELEKLYLCIDGTLITRADLPGVISKTVVNQIFEFTEAVGRRDAKITLRLLDNIYRNDSEPAMWVLSALMNHFEKLLKMVSLKEEGFNASSIAEQCEVHAFRYKKALEPQVKKYTVKDCLKAMKRLCDLDVSFRTSITDKRTAFESFLVDICST